MNKRTAYIGSLILRIIAEGWKHLSSKRKGVRNLWRKYSR